MTRLCVTVAGSTMAEVRARRDAASALADLVEVRLDGVADADPAGAVQGSAKPIIVACHPAWEGGRFHGPEEVRKQLLTSALDAGAEWIDVEWRAGFADTLPESRRERIILSNHVFDGVPADLEERYRAMRATGAAIVKIAVQPRRLSDLAPLFALGDAVNAERTVLLGMGLRGLVTRVLAARLGSEWTYAGSEAAVGQLSADRMIEDFRIRHIGPRSSIYAIVGSPVAHSLSPAMHNAGFGDAGIDAVYVPLDAADAEDALDAAGFLHLEGLSVTAPLKIALMTAARVTSVDAVTARVGALNTLRPGNAGWEATNTDVAGFLAPLSAAEPLAGRRITLLGAGGAARAAAVALAATNAKVSVSARRPDEAACVAALASGIVTPFPPPRGSWDVLINATPVGMAGFDEASPIDPRLLAGGSLVYDLVYWPPVTRLMSDAARAGCRTLGGLPMLVAQAERQFEWWTGVRPRAGLFQDVARKRLEEPQPFVPKSHTNGVSPARHE
jgi:3-dehydroquinate dehydratase / shikimate dehydrogenase